MKRLQMDGDEVLALVSMDARARVADVLDANGNVLPPSQWPETIHNSIEQYEKKADGSVKVKLASKTLARRTLLEQTGKLKSPAESGFSRLAELLRRDVGDADDERA